MTCTDEISGKGNLVEEHWRFGLFAPREASQHGEGRALSDENRRGLTALFWSNINPYGTFRLEMGKRLGLGWSGTVPGQRQAAGLSRPRPRSASDP
ncbi:hypothetical protein [Streptomyces sp. NPDC097640]|uniref:hypothetical protein n=1 Tax=Streptomyces sp. NPDC097640 TaxID=3157229 RepID=UPI003325A566